MFAENTSPSFLIVNGGSHAERETPAPGRLPCGENGEEWGNTHERAEGFPLLDTVTDTTTNAVTTSLLHMASYRFTKHKK